MAEVGKLEWVVEAKKAAESKEKVQQVAEQFDETADSAQQADEATRGVGETSQSMGGKFGALAGKVGGLSGALALVQGSAGQTSAALGTMGTVAAFLRQGLALLSSGLTFLVLRLQAVSTWAIRAAGALSSLSLASVISGITSALGALASALGTIIGAIGGLPTIIGLIIGGLAVLALDKLGVLDFFYNLGQEAGRVLRDIWQDLKKFDGFNFNLPDPPSINIPVSMDDVPNINVPTPGPVRIPVKLIGNPLAEATQTVTKLGKIMSRGSSRLAEIMSRGRKNLTKKLQKAMEQLVKIMKRGWKRLKKIMKRGWGRLKAIMKRGWKRLKKIMGRGWKRLKKIMSRGWGRLKKIMKRGATRLKDTLSNAWTNIKTTIAKKMGNWETVASKKFKQLKKSILKTARNIPTGLISIFSGTGDAMASEIKSAFNAAIPSSLDIPSVSIGGGSIAGQDIPEATIGGGSLNLPQLNTGGFIEESGIAQVHAGEAVVPAEATQKKSNTSTATSGGSDAPDVTIESIEIGDQSLDLSTLDRRELEELAQLIADKQGDELQRYLGT